MYYFNVRESNCIRLPGPARTETTRTGVQQDSGFLLD